MSQTIGQLLIQAREKRGLSIEQAAQATHIRGNYLEALENGQRDRLPSPVQARGFLRLYADFLHLSVADALAVWEGKQPAASLSASEATQAIPSAAEAVVEPGPPAQPDRESSLRPVTEPMPAFRSLRDEAPDDSSQAIFREIGVLLAQQRAALGLSQAEVEQYTRLRPHYIQALEDGNLDQLPSPVQGRGMLSNYAEFLNMDEERLLLRFAEGLQARRLEHLPPPETAAVRNARRRPARQAPLWRRFLTPDLIFGVAAVAVILVFVVWTAARVNALRTAQANPTLPAIVDVLLTPQTTAVNANQTATLEPQGTPRNAENTPDPNIPSGDATLTDQTPQPGFTPNSTENPSLPAVPLEPTTAITVQAINNDPLQVYIVAHQRAWLRVIADDKVQFLGRVVPGNAYTFSGSKRIELLTGDAAGIQVFYNQTDLGILGVAGQVIGMIFSPEGITTPTPAAPPTATPTLPKVATPLPTATPKASATITPYVPQ